MTSSNIGPNKQVYLDRLATVFNTLAPVFKKYSPIMDQKGQDLKTNNPGLDDTAINDFMICDPTLVPVFQAQAEFDSEMEKISVDFKAEFGDDAEDQLSDLILIASGKQTPQP